MSKYYCSVCKGKEANDSPPLTCDICGFSDHLSCHEKKCNNSFICNECQKGLNDMGINLRLRNKRESEYSEYEWKPVGQGPDAMMRYVEKEPEYKYKSRYRVKPSESITMTDKSFDPKIITVYFLGITQNFRTENSDESIKDLKEAIKDVTNKKLQVDYPNYKISSDQIRLARNEESANKDEFLTDNVLLSDIDNCFAYIIDKPKPASARKLF